jgi:hypothetical protein
MLLMQFFDAILFLKIFAFTVDVRSEKLMFVINTWHFTPATDAAYESLLEGGSSLDAVSTLIINILNQMKFPLLNSTKLLE